MHYNDLTELEKATLDYVAAGGQPDFTESIYWMMWKLFDVEMDGTGDVYLTAEGKALLATKGTPNHADES